MKNDLSPSGNSGEELELSFTSLICPLSVISNFVDDNPDCNQLVFNPYFTGNSSFFTLVAYGAYPDQDTTSYKTVPTPPFEVYNDAQQEFNNIALGNLLINTTIISEIAAFAATNGGTTLLFVPSSEQADFKHLTYIMYLAVKSNSGYDIIPLNPILPTEGVNLNPAPPAHIDN